MSVNDQINKNQMNVKKRTDLRKRDERGYVLVGLMAVMMFAMIITTAAAPSIKQEMQREKEEEMLWRGQQVAIAIKRYRLLKGGAYPTDLKDLVQGVDLGVKKIHLLRPSALCDPMTPCADGTNWRTVNPGDPLPKELYEAVLGFQEKSATPLNPQSIQDLARFAQMGGAQLPGQAADTQPDGNISSNGKDGAANETSNPSSNFKLGFVGEKQAPIIGVVSKKKGRMYKSYYGIREYDHALFFPDIPVLAGGFVNPFALDVGGGGGRGIRPANDPRCSRGGFYIDGKCYGGVYDGKNPPNTNPPNPNPPRI